MDTDFFRLFQNFESHLDLGMSKDIQAFLYEREEIKNYSLEVDQEEKVLINIELYNFSRQLSKKIFLEFLSFIGYKNYNLFIYEIKENVDRYWYLTKSSIFDGVKMEIVIA